MASSPILEAALQYAGRGWRVFAISRSKVPFKGSHGYKDGTTDRAALETMFKAHPSANVAAATGQGLAVVDVDSAEGAALLIQLMRDNGCVKLPTLMAETGRAGGGRHLYFKATDAPTNSGDGLDIRGEKGLVILPPSLHKSGTRYRWINPGEAIADMPEWLLAWFRSRPGSARRQEPPAALDSRPDYLRVAVLPRLADRAADGLEELPEPEDLAAAVTLIPNPNLGWDAWNAMMMAIWAASGGAEYGLHIAADYSEKSKKYSEEETAKRWADISKRPPTSIGFGSLVYRAREVDPDFELPSRRPKQEEKEQVKPHETKQSDAADQTETNGVHFPFEEDSDPNALIVLNGFNKRFAAIGDVGGKCLILNWAPSKAEKGVLIPVFQSFKSFSEFNNNQYIKINVKKDGASEEKIVQAGSYWLKWRKRKSYQGIDLSPDPAELPPGYLNLWSGFAVEPAPGDWSLMKRHILDVLAQGDRPSADYIVRFAAWAVQHPGERAEVALVFKGDKGSGKGTFATTLRRLFGAHGLQIYNPKHLVGAFNAHLRNCLLLFSDEAFWAGDKQGESTLKGMITEPALVIEQKGVDAIAWRNRLKVVMSANADWVVPATHEERRYAAFEVSGTRIDDKPYFKALHAQINAGGLAAMLHELQRLPLGDWHPRDIPHTAALREQKARSMKPLDAWWEFLLQEALLPFQWHGSGNKGLAGAILGHLRENAGRAVEVSAYALAKYLEGVGCTGKHEHQGKVWTFPDLCEARRKWEIKWGEWPWREKADNWTKTGVSPSGPSQVHHI
jgi:Bifunctional DNA primase/polymerase, N-terminal/Family of unknown function (DUF5906)/Primase C terminal 2 (PriCT-2)